MSQLDLFHFCHYCEEVVPDDFPFKGKDGNTYCDPLCEYECQEEDRIEWFNGAGIERAY